MGKYTWTGIGPREDAVASGRMSAEALQISPAMSSLSASARRDGLLAELAVAYVSTINVRSYGATGDGVTDDTAAITNAIADANTAGGGIVYFPKGTYKITSTIALLANVKLSGMGPQRSILKRGFNGTMVTITSASDVEISDLALDGNAPTNTGKGVVVSGAGIHRPVFNNLWSISMGAATDTHLEFGADAGQLAKVTQWDFRLGGGTLDFRAIHFNGPDTVGCFRSFSQVVVGNGYISSIGAQDTQFVASAFGRVETDSATQIIAITGCTWANLGVAMTLNGQMMTVVGCRFAGSVTLSSSFIGTFVGNTFSDTSYTFTDNSTNRSGVVYHGRLQNTPFFVQKAALSVSANQEEIQTRRVKADLGDNSFSPALDVDAPVILYNSAITADRSVTLPATARDGYTYRVVRGTGATGAFNVLVKNNGGSTLKTLATAGTWTEVTWSGPASAFIVTGGGTI